MGRGAGLGRGAGPETGSSSGGTRVDWIWQVPGFWLDLAGCGWMWPLAGSGWIRLDLVGSGWIWPLAEEETNLRTLELTNAGTYERWNLRRMAGASPTKEDWRRRAVASKEKFRRREASASVADERNLGKAMEETTGGGKKKKRDGQIGYGSRQQTDGLLAMAASVADEGRRKIGGGADGSLAGYQRSSPSRRRRRKTEDRRRGGWLAGWVPAIIADEGRWKIGGGAEPRMARWQGLGRNQKCG